MNDTVEILLSNMTSILDATNGSMMDSGAMDVFINKDEIGPIQKIADKVVKYMMGTNVIGIMLGMGCAINWREIIQNMWPPIGIIIGMIGQFILLPATAFGFSKLFKLRPYEALGCLIVSCSPGGSFSNFCTYWVEGEIALSIVMTTCSSLLAFGGMPFNLWMYSSMLTSEDQTVVIPFKSIFRGLAFVCGPVIIGMVIRNYSVRIAKIITRVTSIVGYIGFLIIISSYITLYWRVFYEATPLIYCGGLILPATGFTVAYLLAFILGRSHKICRTIGVETGSQNMPIAMSIILLSFDDGPMKSEMLLFPTIYGLFMFIEILLGILLYQGVRKLMDRNKKPKQLSTIHGTTLIEGGNIEEKLPMKP